MKNIMGNWLEYALIGVLIAIVAICVWVVWVGVTTDPLQVYEAAFAECMERESISEEACQSLAERAAYPRSR